MTYPRGYARRSPFDHAAQRAKRRAARRSRFDPRWILPVVALGAPLAGAASASLLQVCLMLAAVAGLMAVRSTGAFWSLVAWGVVTGGFGAMLAFLDAPNAQSLTLVALPVAAVQVLALLGVGRPATSAGWRARGKVLLSLSGPLALTLLAVNATPDWHSLGAALAVALDLAALPLALEARQAMSEGYADLPLPARHGRSTNWPRARRRLWVSAVLLGVAVALVWPAQRLFRLSSSVPFAVAPPISPAQPAPSAILIDQTLTVWKALEATLEPCDRAVAQVDSTPFAPEHATAATRHASTARDACRRAGLSLLALRPPQAAADAGRAAFEEALTRCQYVYLVEGNSHGRLAKALRGGGKGAAKFEAWADVQEANIDALGCRVGFVMAARRSGLPSSLFEPAAPIRPATATRSTGRRHA